MRVIVTGGTGFIGRALIKRLLNGGYEVTVLTRSAAKAERVFGQGVSILEADINDKASLERLDIRSKKIDVAIHLAASLEYFGHGRELYSINVKGTENIFGWAEAGGIAKGIYVSSIEAMGMAGREGTPLDEMSPCRPASSYGRSKLKAEGRAIGRSGSRRMEVSVVRLGNVYGPGSEAFIVPVANAIMQNNMLLKLLPAYRDRILSLVYIDDIADGISLAINKGRNGQAYIITGLERVTAGMLFDAVAEALQARVRAGMSRLAASIYLGLRKNILKLLGSSDLAAYFFSGSRGRIHRLYSVEKAKRELGYSPKTCLKDGVRNTLEWARREGLIKEGEGVWQV